MLAQAAEAMRPFLGQDVAPQPLETAQVVILPIPYEMTTTYRRGCKNGPAALLAASDQLEVYDEELQQETMGAVAVYTHPPIADTRSPHTCSAEQMLATTSQTVAQLIAQDKFVIALGGEHSITAGIVQAYQQAIAEPFTVIQIDAHADLRDCYEGSIHNHACVMRRILEMGLATLPVGIRSLSQAEADLIAQQQIPVIWARAIATQPDWIEQALASISTSKVFITIDLDGIDPGLMPGVGTPEPGGLHWYALLQFLRRVFTRYEVIGCDVMELAPLGDSVVSEFTAAKLVYKLIGYQALSCGWLSQDR